MNSNIKKTVVLLALLLPFVLAFGATDAITRVSFTTEPRTVAPSGISEALTIQLQNSSGQEEKLDETGHLTFISNSATGEFLGSTGKPVTTTMSKGTANRNFYYRDTTSGAHTITVTVTTGIPERFWQTTQIITIGATASGGTDETPPSSQSSSASTQGENQSLSSHSAPSASSPGVRIFKADAGRERTASVHTPVQFEATKESPYAVYRWAFGDGGAGFGNRTTHAYLEPGTFVVVLNADFNGKQEVSRTIVEVFQPQVHIYPGSIGETLVLGNTGTSELNIGAWRLSSASSSYIFPQDTIVLPGRSVKLSEAIINLKRNYADDVYLFYPSGKKAAEYSPRNVLARIADLNIRLSQLKKERLLASIASRQDGVSNPIPAVKDNDSSINNVSIKNNEPRIIEVKKNDSLLRKLLNLFQ